MNRRWKRWEGLHFGSGTRRGGISPKRAVAKLFSGSFFPYMEDEIQETQLVIVLTFEIRSASLSGTFFASAFFNL